MPKYDVEITEKNMYNLTVDAESEEEAITQAFALLYDKKSDYYSDSDAEAEAHEIEGD